MKINKHYLQRIIQEEIANVLNSLYEADDEKTIKRKKTGHKEETLTQTEPTEIKPRTKKQQEKDAKEKAKRRKRIKKKTILKYIDTDKKSPDDSESTEKLKKAFDDKRKKSKK